MRAVPASEIGRRVEAALAMVHLEGRDRRRPSQLSGGQQQRVALARALVVNPSILLLDEPLSNLDAKLRDEMRNEIRAIQQRLGITTVFVTHDQTEALAMCDKIAVMNAGRLVQIGTPYEIYERPSDPFVASFVGRVNRLGGAGGTSGTYRVGEAHLVGQRQLVGAVEIMIRPHRIGLLAPDAAAGEGRNFVPGRIVRVAYIGDLLQIEAETPCGTLLVEHATKSQGLPPRPGDAVGLAWSPADTMVFPRGGG
jgi:putative spermidine/putrescine transport system ATP-binding protein